MAYFNNSLVLEFIRKTISFGKLVTFSSVLLIASCAAYTPQRLPNSTVQKANDAFPVSVSFIAADYASVRKANNSPFDRRVVDGNNLNGAAKLKNVASATSAIWPPRTPPKPYRLGTGDRIKLQISNGRSQNQELALKIDTSGAIRLLGAGRRQVAEVLPRLLPPEEYKIGVHDVLTYSVFIEEFTSTGIPRISIQEQPVRVATNGTVNILGAGEVSLAGKTISEAKNAVEEALLQRSQTQDFQLEIAQFNSKSYLLGGDFSGSIESINNQPVSINDLVTVAMTEASSLSERGMLDFARENSSYVSLRRGGRDYIISAERLIQGEDRFYVQDDDRILLKRGRLESQPYPILVAGMTIQKAEQEVSTYLESINEAARVSIDVTHFNSQRYSVAGGVGSPGVFPLTDVPILIAEALSIAGMRIIQQEDLSKNLKTIEQIVYLKRGGKNYRFSAQAILTNPGELYIEPGDALHVERLNYRPEQVVISGAVKAQRVFPISAETRPTLSQALYETSSFDLSSTDPSQIYVLRATNEENAIAYHFDVANPARLILASEFELRPNDVVFLAEQPVSEFNRVVLNLLSGLGTIRTIRDQARNF